MPPEQPPPPDPATLARLRESVRHTAARGGSRSRLAPYEDQVLELFAKGCTYEFVRGFLTEHLGWKPALSTLHHFVKAAERRRRRRGSASTPAPQAAAQPPAQSVTASSQQPGGAEPKSTVAATIRALKANSLAAKTEPPRTFAFDPTKPLLDHSAHPQPTNQQKNKRHDQEEKS